MSAMRLRKPIEANDGSYGGLVLACFDRLDDQRVDLGRPRRSECRCICHAPDGRTIARHLVPCCRPDNESVSEINVDVAFPSGLFCFELEEGND